MHPTSLEGIADVHSLLLNARNSAAYIGHKDKHNQQHGILNEAQHQLQYLNATIFAYCHLTIKDGSFGQATDCHLHYLVNGPELFGIYDIHALLVE